MKGKNRRKLMNKILNQHLRENTASAKKRRQRKEQEESWEY